MFFLKQILTVFLGLLCCVALEAREFIIPHGDEESFFEKSSTQHKRIQEISFIGADGEHTITYDEIFFYLIQKNNSEIQILKFIGQFKNGKANGKGQIIFSDFKNEPIEFEGYFVDGKIKGEGKFTFIDTIITGYFDDDLFPEGLATYYSLDGKILGIKTLHNRKLAPGPIAFFLYPTFTDQASKKFFGDYDGKVLNGSWQVLPITYENSNGNGTLIDHLFYFKFKNGSSFQCDISDQGQDGGVQKHQQFFFSYGYDMMKFDPMYSDNSLTFKPFCRGNVKYISPESWTFIARMDYDYNLTQLLKCFNPEGREGTVSFDKGQYTCTYNKIVHIPGAWDKIKKVAHAIRDFPQKAVNEFTRFMDGVTEEVCTSIGKTPGKDCHIGVSGSYTVDGLPILEEDQNAKKQKELIIQKTESIKRQTDSKQNINNQDSYYHLATLITEGLVTNTKNPNELRFLNSLIDLIAQDIKNGINHDVRNNLLADADNSKAKEYFKTAKNVYGVGKRTYDAYGNLKKLEERTKFVRDLFATHSIHEALFNSSFYVASVIDSSLPLSDRIQLQLSLDKILKVKDVFAATTLSSLAVEMWLLPYKLMFQSADFFNSAEFKSSPFVPVLNRAGLGSPEATRKFYSEHPNIKNEKDFYQAVIETLLTPVFKIQEKRKL